MNSNDSKKGSGELGWKEYLRD